MGAANPEAFSRDPLSIGDVLKIAHDLRPAYRARLLPGDRRWRRFCTDSRRARAKPRQAAGLCAGHGGRALASPDFANAGPYADRRIGVGAKGFRDGGTRTERHRRRRALRRVHDQHHPVSRRPGLLRQGRRRRVCRGRRDRTGRQVAGQHQRRRPIVRTSRHVRHLHHDRSGAPAAKRRRAAASRRRRDRALPRQRRRVVVAGHRHSR